MDAKDRVRGFFAQYARAYTASPSHRSGRDLDRLVALLDPRGHERLLDVATASGHTALALAPRVREVVGLDLTPAMAAEFAAEARARGFPAARFVVGDVEAIPFPAASFDLVTCRRAAHHFPDIPRALAEMARVLCPGGRLGLADMVAPDSPAAAHFFNDLERARDPSHQRALNPAEWLAAVAAAGLEVQAWELVAEEVPWDQWLSPVPPDSPEGQRAYALAQAALAATGAASVAEVLVQGPGGLAVRKRRLVLVAAKPAATPDRPPGAGDPHR